MKNQISIYKFPVINPRYISYSYFGVSIIVCTVFLYFFVRPTLLEAGKLVKTIRKGQEIDQKLTIKLENLAKAETIINENKDLIPLIDLALPNIVNTPDFVDKVTTVALENNVFISNMAVVHNDETKKYNADTVSFNINFSGDYNNIYKFINSLENNLQMLTTKNLSISKNTENYNANLTLTTYGYTYNADNISTTIVPFSGDQK